ncbi:MAG: hypothetical protein J6T96_05250 [Bacteroidales bacterium]|nr:hypothetical protein [Bacteroidales bacterium]
MKSSEILVKIENEVARFNGSFEINDANKADVEKNEALANLDSLVEDYNKILKIELYNQLVENDNPLIKAIEEFVCPSFRVRDIKNSDGAVTSKSVYDEDNNLNIKYKTIDILDFDKYTGFVLANEKGWQYKLERFSQLMCLKVALELGYTKAKVNEIGKTYYLSKLAEKIEMGQTPTSNTQALKNLQAVIDSIIYEDDGNGKNKYKATSHDIAYIDHLIAKKGKSALTVSVVNSRMTRELVTAVLHRIITDKKYVVDYKKKTTK